ncbi:MAG: GerAB/ArcD/ProY family transporter [Oscillospiraceae bacterium]
MSNRTLTIPQAVALLVVFMFGTVVILGINSDNEQDSLIAFCTSIVFIIPFGLIFAKIAALNPETDLFQITERVLGKVFASIAAVLILWYCVLVAGAVVFTFVCFVQVTSMPETPSLLFSAGMIAVCIYLAKSPVSTLGKCSVLLMIILVLFMAFITFMLIGEMHVENLMPFFEHPLPKMFYSGFGTAVFPFSQSFLLLALGNSFKQGASMKKVFIWAFLIEFVIFFFVIFRNLTVLGYPMLVAEYYPSFIAARLVKFGTFMMRIEVLVTLNMVLAGIIKVTLCLIAGAKAVAYLLRSTDYRRMVMPVSLLILAESLVVFRSAADEDQQLKSYPLLNFPVSVLLPVVILIASLIKKHRTPAAPKPHIPEKIP